MEIQHGLLMFPRRSQGYVALKVLRSDCYSGSHDIYELELLQAISRASEQSSNPGRNHIVNLLDHFHHLGPNGNHVCLVFEVLGPHLDFQAAKFNKSRIPVRAMREVARQLLLGLDFLHRECGVIHTGKSCLDIFVHCRGMSDHMVKLLAPQNPHT